MKKTLASLVLASSLALPIMSNNVYGDPTIDGHNFTIQQTTQKMIYDTMEETPKEEVREMQAANQLKEHNHNKDLDIGLYILGGFTAIVGGLIGLGLLTHFYDSYKESKKKKTDYDFRVNNTQTEKGIDISIIDFN